MAIELNGTTGITTPGLTNTGSETVINLTTSGNTILGDASTDTLNVGNGGLVKDASGNVGIGSSSITGIGANVTTLKIAGRNTTNAGGIQLYSSDDTTVKARTWAETGGWYFDLQTAQSMIFNTSGTERMRLDSSGNLSVTGTINKISPAATNTQFFGVSGGTTAYTYGQITNTGGSLNWGIDTSTGGGLITGTAAYSSSIYTGTSTPLHFGTNNTLRMTLDASGKLLVGTTTASANGRVVVLMPDASNGTGLVIRAQNVGGGTSQPSLVFENPNGTINSQIISDNGTGYLAFNQAGAERMRITSLGDLRVGCITEPGAGSLTTGCEFFSGGAVLVHRSAATPCYFGRSNDGEVMALFSGTTQRGIVSIAGATTTYGSISDYRLKENVGVITDGLAKVMTLKPSTFNFIEFPNKTVNGFIAHEVAEVEPIAVTGEKDYIDEDGKPVYQSIDPAKLVPLLTAAIQEQQAMIDELKAKVAALEAA
jgi:hypothetical protein